LVGRPTRAQRGLYRLRPAPASLFSPNFSVPLSLSPLPQPNLDKKEMPQLTYLLLSSTLLCITMFSSTLLLFIYNLSISYLTYMVPQNSYRIVEDRIVCDSHKARALLASFPPLGNGHICATVSGSSGIRGKQHRWRCPGSSAWNRHLYLIRYF
jgi:hypothetical protein